MTDWEGLTPPYATLVVDPPWPYPEGWPPFGPTSKGGDRPGRRRLPYSSMSIAEIKALPVAQLAKTEGYLFLWATDRYLEDALAVVRAWGFTKKQTVVWCKQPGGQRPGGMFATTAEFIIVAQKINPGANAHGRRTKGRVDRSWFEWPRGAHSEKPAAFLDMVEQVSPGPYVELFARRQRIGWDSWGYGYEQLA